MIIVLLNNNGKKKKHQRPCPLVPGWNCYKTTKYARLHALKPNMCLVSRRTCAIARLAKLPTLLHCRNCFYPKPVKRNRCASIRLYLWCINFSARACTSKMMMMMARNTCFRPAVTCKRNCKPFAATA